MPGPKLAVGIAAMLVLASGLAAGTVGALAGPTAGATALSVRLGEPREFSLAPTARVTGDGLVAFRAHNGGRVGHELIVIRTSTSAAKLPTHANGNAVERGSLGEVELAPGATKTLRLRLKPGRYALICNKPGHYHAGMHADIVVR
jgi:uncharacterized cupredoxin-like copper-binding protein